MPTPWDNLKFDLKELLRCVVKFFGTLYNTYSFFDYMQILMDLNMLKLRFQLNERPEIDRGFYLNYIL
jgi:isoleucyl-tRNA synthetase